MDYLMGAVGTLITIWFISYRLNAATQKIKIRPPLYTQSQTFELTRYSGGYYHGFDIQDIMLKTQATEYFDKRHTRVVVYEDKAYWILNNKLYSAEFDGEEVLKDSTQEVDTMGMDRVELDQVVFIVDLLTEGNSNDSGNSGNTQI